ncbi:hypothetical protein NQZ68_002537 [Dissostichus eleginoides]|nr:hypothetical protein NQZ68_002537 [Dissostichus eleginoides]
MNSGSVTAQLSSSEPLPNVLFGRGRRKRKRGVVMVVVSPRISYRLTKLMNSMAAIWDHFMCIYKEGSRTWAGETMVTGNKSLGYKDTLHPYIGAY